RMYDPALGRFLQRDTAAGKVGNPLTLNRYTYAGDNPVSNLDPGGHWFLPLGGLFQTPVCRICYYPMLMGPTGPPRPGDGLVQLQMAIAAMVGAEEGGVSPLM